MPSLLCCEHQLIKNASALQSGDVIYSSDLEKYGLYIEENKIIFQKTPNQFDAEGNHIVQTSLSKFVGDNELFKVLIDKADGVEEIITRALNSLGTESSEGVFSCLGDDFIYWCFTKQYIMPDSNIFGKHLCVNFQDDYIHTIYAVHHGIGIDNLLVVHFDKSCEKNFGWNKCIQCCPYEKFQNNQLVTIHEYSNESDEARLSTRNRALYILFGDHQYRTYQLFSNNCEHLACWCKTGKRNSSQINELLQNIAIIGFTAACFITQKKFYPQTITLGEKIAGKYFKFPWKKLQ